MKFLLQGHESSKKVALLLSLTQIDSEDIINAINDHLVGGKSQTAAAALNQVPKGNLNRNLDKLNEVAEVYEQLKIEEKFSTK